MIGLQVVSSAEDGQAERSAAGAGRRAGRVEAAGERASEATDPLALQYLVHY